MGEISEEKNENAGTAKLILHVVNIGIIFWKVDSKAHLVLTLPSSETFFGEKLLTRQYFATGCSKTGVHLREWKTPPNVELRTFIESHFKCTITNVKSSSDLVLV